MKMGFLYALELDGRVCYIGQTLMPLGKASRSRCASTEAGPIPGARERVTEPLLLFGPRRLSRTSSFPTQPTRPVLGFSPTKGYLKSGAGGSRRALQ